MTSRQYDDYCRVNALLKKMRYEDLLILNCALNIAVCQEERHSFHWEAFIRLKKEVDEQIKSCVVD